MTIVPFIRPRPPPRVIDKPDILVVTRGGTKSRLNLVEPAVISPACGRLAKVVVIAGGTDGAFMLNDCAALADTGAANTIFTLPFGAAAGTIYDLDWPCLVGIVLSAVPDDGILVVSYNLKLPKWTKTQ